MLSRCFLDFSVSVRAFVIGLSQISSFFFHWRARKNFWQFYIYRHYTCACTQCIMLRFLTTRQIKKTLIFPDFVGKWLSKAEYIIVSKVTRIELVKIEIYSFLFWNNLHNQLLNDDVIYVRINNHSDPIFFLIIQVLPQELRLFHYWWIFRLSNRIHNFANAESNNTS